MYSKLLKRHKYRKKLAHRRTLLQRMPQNSICAEIGVWKGDFSQRILEIVQPQELHLIDPWAFQNDFPGRMYGGGVARSQLEIDQLFEGVRERFMADLVVRLHRGYSADVLTRFPDGYFDWIYIDGDHSYDAVFTDLRLCWRKIKPTGLLAGDDYRWQPRESKRWSRGSPPVQRAVRDFMNGSSLKGDSLSILGSQFIIERKETAG